MEDSFDPYLQWLGIRDKTRPPNHYRLLGIDLFESDADVISSAADRQMAYVRSFQSGQRAELSQKVLNELAAARLCLLKPEQKSAYDIKLRQHLHARQPVPLPPPASPTPGGAADGLAGGERALSEFELPFSPTPTLEYRRRPARRSTIVKPVLFGGLLLLLSVAAVLVWRARQNEETEAPSLSEVENSRPTPRPSQTKPPPVESAVAEPTVETSGVDPPSPPADQSTNQSPTQPPPENVVSTAQEINRALDEARRYLAMRDPAQARSALAVIKSSAIPARQRSSVKRLDSLCDHVQRFWDAAVHGLSLLMPGDRLMVDGQLLTVVTVGGELVTHRMSDGADQSWSLRPEDMNARLAAAIAERSWNAGAGAVLVTVGAFWAMDRQADRPLAQQLWQRAQAEGSAVADLLPELRVPQPDSVHASPNFGVVTMRSSAPQTPADTDNRRISPPNEEQLEAAMTKVRATYKAEIDLATTDEAKSELADRLDQRATNVGSDPAGQFAFWKLAQELALAAGDVQLTLSIIGHRGERFDIDALQEQQSLISDQIGQNRGTVLVELLLSALSVATEAANAERFELATKLTQLAKTQAARAKNKSLEKEAIARDRQFKDAQKTYDVAQKAMERLKTDPDNPRDNAAVGRYYSFVKRDFGRGLPLLAKGNDERLAKAATLELAKPTSAQAQLELADAWWASGEAATSPNRVDVLRRAQHWYDQAKESLSGTEKSRVEKRLTAIADATSRSQGSGTGELVELPLPQGVKLRLRQILPGKFVMGSPATERGRMPDETQHAVLITRPFFLGLTEVTQAQWFAVVGNNPSSAADPDRPVDMVSWSDCQGFCQLLNQSRLGSKYQFRLPSEAEWEYACRAGTRTAFYFGDTPAELSEYAWCLPNGGRTSSPVGRLKPNAWGLYDMAGNVAEWCQDYRVPFTSETQTDPLVENGLERVFRGGSAWEDPMRSRSASRLSNPESQRRNYVGFRVAATLKSP